MERPPKKCVCEKCGYLGDTSEHEGCDYLAWTTGEQRYIDRLEAELAALRASPASAPEGWKIVPVEPTGEMVDAGIRSLGTADKFRAMLAAAPTPPVSEDRKDAERYRWLRDIGNNTWKPMIKRGITATQCDSAIDAGIVAMQEDKP